MFTNRFRVRLLDVFCRYMKTEHPDAEDEDGAPVDWEYAMGAELDAARFVQPDAFRFDEEKRILTLVEVEDTSRITWSKYDAYHDLWWALDTHMWWLELVIVERSGMGQHVDMDHESYHFIEDRHVKRGKRPRLKMIGDLFDATAVAIPSRNYE